MCGEPKSKHALIQIVQKLNKKTSFLTESKQRHLNLKLTEITSYMKGAASSSTPRSLR